MKPPAHPADFCATPATRPRRPWLAWALALGLLTALTPAQAARLALVVGNDSYHALRPLQNATRDARDMVTELRAAGFKVPDKWLVLNATQRQMDAALQDFVASLRPEDEVVFFYAGHGVEIDAQAALVPVDLPNPAYRPLDGSLRPLSEIDQAKQQVLNQSITLNRVARDIAQRQVKFSLLVVDACRDNPVLELLREAHRNNPARSGGPAPAVGLIADAAADTQVLLFSASKGQQALDRLGERDPVKNGVFTRVLLKALRTPGLGLRDMLPQVKAEVKQLAAQVQTDGRPHQQEPRSMAAYDAPNFYFRPPTTSRPGSTSGLNLDDLQREQGARQEWATWQVRMQSDHDKTAAFTGSPDLRAQAWQRFLEVWKEDNPTSAEDEGLRAQATGKLGQARAEVAQQAQQAQEAQRQQAAAQSAGETLDGRYQILSGGAEVKDLQTGLVWQRCSVGQRWSGSGCTGTAQEFKWDAAQTQSGNGWRVPTVRELQSLRVCFLGFTGEMRDLGDGKAQVPQRCADGYDRPTIHKGAFPQTPASWYWTSSPYAGDASGAWDVGFGYGNVNVSLRDDVSHVRLVR